MIKKNKALAICVTVVVLLIGLSFPEYAQAEDGGGLHRYWGIPFDTVTPEEVQRTLQEKVGVTSIDEFGMYRITDFGYEFDVQVDFNANEVGANRIVLHRAGSGWGRGGQFRDLAERDVLQFIDMENQLIHQYGEPDFRFFYTDAGKYKQKNLTRFMFSTGKWDAAQMMEVCDNDKYLVAHTVWGNVMLRVWVNWIDERTFGYLTKLALLFEEKSSWQTLPVMVEYPPVSAS